MPSQKNRESVFNHTIRRSLLGVLPTIAWFLSPNAAHAEPPHYRIELKVPPSLPQCNREADLIGMVLPMLAGPVLDPLATHVVEVKIAKKPGILSLDLAIKDPEGKTLEEEHADFPADLSCFEVLYRGALRVAVQINKGVTAADANPAKPPRPPPSPPAPPPPLPQCPQPKAVPRSAPKKATAMQRWHVGLGGSTVLGAAPTTVVGPQLTFGWHWKPSWFIEANVRGTFPTDAVPNGLTPIHIYSLGTIAIAPCHRWKSLGGCGLVSWNPLWTRSDQLDNLRSDTIQFLGAGVRGFIEHRFTDRWSVRFDGDLAFRFMLSSLENVGSLESWKPTPITATGNVTFFVSF